MNIRKSICVTTFAAIFIIFFFYQSKSAVDVCTSCALEKRQFQNKTAAGLIWKRQSMKTGKFLIYACTGGLCGGWANRLYGIVMTYTLAKLSGRTFKIKHSAPCDLDLFFDSNKVDWKLRESEISSLTEQKLYYVDSRDFKKSLTTVDLTRIFKAEVVYVTINWDFTPEIRRRSDVSELGGFNTITVAEIYRRTLDEIFKYRSDFLSELEEFKAKEIGNKKLVCAHIRIADHNSNYIGDPDVIWNWFRLYNTSESVFFLATNRQNLKDNAKQVLNTHFIDIPGEITHVDKAKGANACLGFKKALMDHALLSSCDVLLLSSSGFGITSAYRRGTSNNLFCKVENLIFPCSIDVLHDIFVANLGPFD